MTTFDERFDERWALAYRVAYCKTLTTIERGG